MIYKNALLQNSSDAQDIRVEYGLFDKVTASHTTAITMHTFCG